MINHSPYISLHMSAKRLLTASYIKDMYSDKYLKRSLLEPQLKKTIAQYALSALKKLSCFLHMLISCHEFKHADEKYRLSTSSPLFQRKRVKTKTAGRNYFPPYGRAITDITGSSDTFVSKHYL